MTSTNDGKDVKSNQTSGQKGKTYYIELYKSLDSRLGESSGSERTTAVCEAWRRVHSLCQHSAPNTHPHLLAWLQRHTSITILQNDWPKATDTSQAKEQHKWLEEAINAFILECREAKAQRDGVSPAWESQLLQRALWFKSTLYDPWGHPVLRALLKLQENQLMDEEVLGWLKQERGITFVTRLKQLAASRRCRELALRLAAGVMERVRAGVAAAPDADQATDKQTSPKAESSFMNTLQREAGFKGEVWNLITDIEFVLLHSESQSRCIELAKQTPLHNCYNLVDRLQGRLETSPRDKKIWKNAKEVAALIAQVVIARCMVIPTCTGAAALALYRNAAALVRLLPAPQLPGAAAALAAPAPTAAHLHMLAVGVHAQCKDERKSFVCELYVRAITAGMNELERLKLKIEKESEARYTEQTLSKWFTQLGSLLSASSRLNCECLLTAFSVHPSQEMYEQVKNAPKLEPLHKDTQETNPETNSEFGSWANDSRTQTNLVKTSETLNMKSQKQANVLSTAIFAEGEALGLGADLCQDLAVLISGPRVKTLTWDTERESLLENCCAYMERTHSGTRAVTTELKYLNLDPRSFQHLPEEDDEENDAYYGIEKGYEHLVERVEDQWEDEFMYEGEQTDVSHSTGESVIDIPKRKKISKPLHYSSEEEVDPLSLDNMKKSEKQERSHSKERSKDRRKEKHKLKEGTFINLDESKEHSQEKTKEIRKKEKKKERKEHKKKEKIAAAKVVGSTLNPQGGLSRLIGMKVAKQDDIINLKETSSSFVNLCMSDSDYDSQGKSSINSEHNDPNVLFDGLFSMDEIKSPERSMPTNIQRPTHSFGVNRANNLNLNNLNKTHSTPNLYEAAQLQKNQAAVVNRSNDPHQADSLVKKSIKKLLEFRRNKDFSTKTACTNVTSLASCPNNLKLSPLISNTQKSNSNDKWKLSLVSSSDKNDFVKSYSNRGNAVDYKKVVAEPVEVLVPAASNTSLKSNSNVVEAKKSLQYAPYPIKKVPQPVIKQSNVSDVNLSLKPNMMNTESSSQKQYKEFLKQRSSVVIKKQPTKSCSDTLSQIQFQEFLKEQYVDSLQGPVRQYQTKNTQNSLQQTLLNSNIPPGQIHHQSFLKELRESANAGTTEGVLEAKSHQMLTKSTPKQQKKVNNAPNTFSRRNYLHKTKQSDSKIKLNPKQTKQGLGISMEEMHNLGVDYNKVSNLQTKGEIVISRLDVKDKGGNKCAKPILSKVDHSNSLQKQNSIPSVLNKQHPIMTHILSNNETYGEKLSSDNEIKNTMLRQITAPNSNLSEKDQDDLLLLLRQQSKMNVKPTPKTEIENKGVCTNSKLPNVDTHLKNSTLSIGCQKLGTNLSSQQDVTCPARHSTVIKANDRSSVNASEPKKSRNIKGNSKNSKQSSKSSSNDSSTSDWESVMNALLAHKTPSRGPNALDVALKKDSFERRLSNEHKVMSSGQCSASSTKTERSLLKHSATKSPSNSSSLPKKQNAQDFKPRSEKNINKLTNTKESQIEIAKRGVIRTKQKHNPSVIQNRNDPFISGIPNSDFDLLGDLMDDDLRQEIGELLADDEAYGMPSVSTKIKNVPNDLYSNANKTNTTPVRKPQLIIDGRQAKNQGGSIITSYSSDHKEDSQIKSSNVISACASVTNQNSKLRIISNELITPTMIAQKANNHIVGNMNSKPDELMNKNDGVKFEIASRSENTDIPKVEMTNLNVFDPTQIVLSVPQTAPNVMLIGNDVIYNPYTIQHTVSQNITGYENNSFLALNQNASNLSLFGSPTYPVIFDSAVSVPVMQSVPTNITVVPNITLSAPVDANPEEQTYVEYDKLENSTYVTNESFDTISKTEHTIKSPVSSSTNAIIKENPTQDLKTNQSIENSLDNVITKESNNFFKGNQAPSSASMSLDENYNTNPRIFLRHTSQANDSAVKKVDSMLSTMIQKSDVLINNTCTDQNIKESIIIDQKKIDLKRMQVLNRKINHHCNNNPIALTYEQINMPNLDSQQKITNREDGSDKIIASESDENVNVILEKTNEDDYLLQKNKNENRLETCDNVTSNNVQNLFEEPVNNIPDNEYNSTCRRILLRSSNCLVNTNKDKSSYNVSIFKTSKKLKVNRKVDRIESLKLESMKSQNLPPVTKEEDKQVAKTNNQNISFIDLEDQIPPSVIQNSSKDIFENNAINNNTSEDPNECNNSKYNDLLGPTTISKNVIMDEPKDLNKLIDENSDDTIKKSNILNSNLKSVEKPNATSTNLRDDFSKIDPIGTDVSVKQNSNIKDIDKVKKRNYLKFEDKIVFDELPNNSNDPLIKCVRVKLPNGNSFKVTISGKLNVEMDEIFEEPTIKAMILKNINTNKKCTLNVKQVKVKSQAKASTVTTHVQDVSHLKHSEQEPETIDLVSDDEENNPKTFQTEFGAYKCAFTDKSIFIKHQDKLSQKCVIKLVNCRILQQIPISNLPENVVPNEEESQTLATDCTIVDDFSKDGNEIIDKNDICNHVNENQKGIIGLTENENVLEEPLNDVDGKLITNSINKYEDSEIKNINQTNNKTHNDITDDNIRTPINHQFLNKQCVLKIDRCDNLIKQLKIQRKQCFVNLVRCDNIFKNQSNANRSVSQFNAEFNIKKNETERVSLQAASVQETSLQEKSLQEACAQDIYLQEATTQEISLQQPTLQEKLLHKAIVQQSTFQESSLQETSIQKIFLQEAAAQGTTLQETYAQQSTLQESSLQETSVQKIALKEKVLKEASVHETSLQDVFVQVKKSSLQEVSEQEISLQESSLQEISFQETTLRETFMEEKAVQQASFQGTTLLEKPLPEVSVQEISFQESSDQVTSIQETSLQRSESLSILNDFLITDENKSERSSPSLIQNFELPLILYNESNHSLMHNTFPDFQCCAEWFVTKSIITDKRYIDNKTYDSTFTTLRESKFDDKSTDCESDIETNISTDSLPVEEIEEGCHYIQVPRLTKIIADYFTVNTEVIDKLIAIKNHARTKLDSSPLKRKIVETLDRCHKISKVERYPDMLNSCKNSENYSKMNTRNISIIDINTLKTETILSNELSYNKNINISDYSINDSNKSTQILKEYRKCDVESKDKILVQTKDQEQGIVSKPELTLNNLESAESSHTLISHYESQDTVKNNNGSGDDKINSTDDNLDNIRLCNNNHAPDSPEQQHPSTILSDITTLCESKQNDVTTESKVESCSIKADCVLTLIDKKKTKEILVPNKKNLFDIISSNVINSSINVSDKINLTVPEEYIKSKRFDLLSNINYECLNQITKQNVRTQEKYKIDELDACKELDSLKSPVKINSTVNLIYKHETNHENNLTDNSSDTIEERSTIKIKDSDKPTIHEYKDLQYSSDQESEQNNEKQSTDVQNVQSNIEISDNNDGLGNTEISKNLSIDNQIQKSSQNITRHSNKQTNVTLVYKGDSRVVLNGSIYEDPVIGTCYVFPILNRVTIKDAIHIHDDTSINVLEPEMRKVFGSNNEVDNEEVESENLKLNVIVPKHTYSKQIIDSDWKIRTRMSRTNLKRKIIDYDGKSNKKKYRKGKNIDIPKLTVCTMSETAYGKEYRNLFNYWSSIKFSFSRPFHKDCVDVVETLKCWPMLKVHIDKEAKNEFKKILFIDDDVENEKLFDPLRQTLAEEISSEYVEPQITSDEINETNFSMGFGEGSDRVIQNSENGDKFSKFSAATLSDVKQCQPFLLSEDNDECNELHESKVKQMETCNRFYSYINLRDKVRSFFKKSTLDLHYNWLLENSDKKIDLDFDNGLYPYDIFSTDFIQPAAIETIVNVVQVGQQIPVSAAAQNPVTCDPRVTQVTDASPQCSAENSPHENSQSPNKTEYTELTTADISVPLPQEYERQTDLQQSSKVPTHNENIPVEIEMSSDEKSNIHDQLSQTENDQNENENDNLRVLVSKHIKNVEYSYDSNENTTSEEVQSNPEVSYEHIDKNETETTQQKQQNGTIEKTDQIAHAMSAAGITPSPEPAIDSETQPLVDMFSPKICQDSTSTTNNFAKTSINAMMLQQALAQIVPPPLTQGNSQESNQVVSNSTVGSQVLHIVQGKNANGNQITVVDNTQNSIISNSTTPVLHIVQNKASNNNISSNLNTVQHNSFSGLSLVDTGLQQGNNQLLHIVNTGSQKSNSTGQILKRVNLLTNLANVQGTTEQKMLQFVCKSADGKSIQLNAPHQRSMVLRLQPFESPNVQDNSKTSESQDLSPTSNNNSNAANKEYMNGQHEIKSRSVYEENYAKFIQSSNNKSGTEKSTSLPKFNQAFGKQIFQDGNQKNSDINTNNPHLSSITNESENSECPSNENNLSLEHISQIGSPPLLLRKSPAPSTQAQSSIVQQIKQAIAPMMHGGVIYTRQIPVNIGGGQTINLITVPSTELVDDSNQKPQGDMKFVNQSEMESPVIKIIPQNQNTQSSQNNEMSADESNNNHTSSTNENTQNLPTQHQPVFTQMRIKLPMLSKAPQMMSGARVVRPSFFQIQRNVIGGANQPVYQQLVLTAAPQLGQHTIRLPQTHTRQVKVASEGQSSSESQMSSSTLEQLREFDMVLEQVKERSTVQPNTNNSFCKINTSSSETTENTSVTSTITESTQQILYSIGTNQALNVAYVNRKPSTATAFVRSPDSSNAIDSSSSSTHSQIPHSATSESTSSEVSPQQNQPKAAKIGSKSKSRSKSSSHAHNPLKINTVPPKTSTQKPLEDEQTTQRILYILAEYKEQVENSPDKDKPAPRRRSNPPSNPSGSSKRKKSCSSSRRPGGRDMSPVQGDDTCRTMGSEDSSCGTSQGDCTENCLEPISPQDSPRKVARKLTFENETTASTQPRQQPQRNVIVADGQTITVSRGTAGKPTTAVLMPANYILPVSMVKGGQQIAIVTNRGPKLLTVGGETGNALLLQRLIGPAGLKPVLTRPGVRHVRLPTAALHNLQAFNLTTSTPVHPPENAASPAPTPTPPDLIDSRASSSPWADRESQDVKPERASSPEGSEPWHLTADLNDYSYEETVRTENLDRTVLDAIPDRYSPDMEAQRIFDKMFDVDSKRSYIVDSQDETSRCAYDIDASDCDDKAYHQVVHKRDGHRQHRLAHAALRHKYAILEHELRLQGTGFLQKSLSEECEDLGVDSPSASELFPEAELLFSSSPAHDAQQHSHTPQPTTLNQSGIPQPDIDDQIATDHLLQSDIDDQQDLGVTLGLDEGIVTVSEDGMQATIALDQEEFARSHPNTTFHSEPTEETEVQPFTITGLKGRHITSTIFHAGRAPATVLVTAPQTSVISQATQENVHHSAKYANIEHIINSSHGNLNLTKFDNILTDSRELHLSHTASAIVHSTGNATQVIRRVRYEDDRRDARYLMDDSDGVIAGDDAKMITEDSSREATLESMADGDDDNSSPERHAELFWESNSTSERSERGRHVDYNYSSDSEKCCKSPFDETNSTDSSGVGTHMRLDTVIKEARLVERAGSGSSDDHPPLRTYPAKRMYHHPDDVERSLSGKTRAGFQEERDYRAENLAVRRRSSVRGVVKRGCHCCNGSPVPPRPKKPKKKPTIDFTN